MFLYNRLRVCGSQVPVEDIIREYRCQRPLLTKSQAAGLHKARPVEGALLLELLCQAISTSLLPLWAHEPLGCPCGLSFTQMQRNFSGFDISKTSIIYSELHTQVSIPAKKDSCCPE